MKDILNSVQILLTGQSHLNLFKMNNNYIRKLKMKEKNLQIIFSPHFPNLKKEFQKSLNLQLLTNLKS